LTTDKRGRQIQRAIARRDAVALRRLAAAADREEGRMWLTLLARMLELDVRRRRRHRMQPRGVVVFPPTRRAGMRRAV